MAPAQIATQDFADVTFWRGDPCYERARRGEMWNCRVPARYPDVIARPRSEEEVVAAVRLARKRDLKIAVRSGGHSWAASFLRDGGMLIDLSGMREFTIDALENTTSIDADLS